MNLLRKLVFCCGFMLLIPLSKASVIYQNDFETSADNAWSATNLDVTPVGNRRFLGQFLNESVSLTLNNLNLHNRITVSFDLFVINSWDGNQIGGGGYDYFMFDVFNGANLLTTTFSNTEEFTHNQSYSAVNAQGDFAAHTGAAEVDSLGYSFFGDSVYNFSFTFAHTASDIQFDFSASGLQNLADESWGIDNVMVEATTVQSIPEPSILFLFAFSLMVLVRKFK